MNLHSLFQPLHILVVGDVILDSYWLGRADRISPEAPVPVVLFEREEHRLGGAANVALNIQALGATPHLVSVVGDDAEGRQFLSLMEEKKMPTDGIFLLKNRQTTVKTRIIVKNQQLLRCDKEINAEINADETQQLWAQIVSILNTTPIHAIIFQDYDKGVITLPLIERLQDWAKTHQVPTAVDPKKRHFLHYRGATLFKPNLREVCEGLGVSIPERHFSLEQLEQAAQAIHRQLGNSYTLITLGAKGMYLSSSDTQFLQPTRERIIADVCGAGDTVISVAALCLAAGMDIHDTVALANIAGGQVCEQWGVVPVNATALQAEYDALRNKE